MLMLSERDNQLHHVPHIILGYNGYYKFGLGIYFLFLRQFLFHVQVQF